MDAELMKLTRQVTRLAKHVRKARRQRDEAMARYRILMELLPVLCPTHVMPAGKIQGVGKMQVEENHE